MRYAVFLIPRERIIPGGGWDDLFYRTDDLADARMLVARDPHQTVTKVFPGLMGTPEYYYQIVELISGDVILDTRDNTENLDR
jgi:hypothetical protein